MSDPDTSHVDGEVKKPVVAQVVSGSSHPVASLCHIIFKALAILFFITSSFFFSSYIKESVIQIFLLAIDFYATKNIFGRLLVGLKWYSEFNHTTGKSEWRYESKEDVSIIPKIDSTVFWTGLWVSTLVWCGFVLLILFMSGLKALVIIFVGIALNGANLLGFIRCSKDRQAKLKEKANSYLASAGKYVVSNQLKNL
ncbi:hypothetical protein PCE1_003355 [Barthelona sp. PCE]